ncbi:MAG: NAD binding domain of 6-phosphogluconate dehydrogenase-domain-containing protein [Linnemannia gamsii]|nr:MAG: NAD binding domain of 6-phosphogluconate dehydrogenase-domain-containing protein [Linnemannia gamsii]
MTLTNTPQNIKVGWIGIGEMGFGMAKNLNAFLISQGSHLTIWNRSPGQKIDLLRQEGAHIATSLDDLAASSNIIFTSLSNDAAVESVYKQLFRHASTTQEPIIFIETSTIHPSVTAKNAELLSQYPQHTYLQCPVFGRPDRALAGQLVWITSGPLTALEKVKPFISSMAKGTIDLNTRDVTKASSFKLLGNFFVAGSIELLAEGLALAEKVDIPQQSVLDLINGLFGSPVWIGYSQKIASGVTTKEGGYPVELALKDVGHMRSLAKEHGASLPTADVAYRHLETMKAQGKGDQDWTSLIEVIREGPPSLSASHNKE